MPQKIGPIALFGAGGFLGKNLLQGFEEAGFDVRIPVSRSGGRVDISGSVDDIRESIGNAALVINAAGRAHLHDDNPAAFWPANALGAWRVAEAAAGAPSVRRLIHVSSVSVGAGGMHPPVAMYQPFTAYGASKAAGEIAVSAALRGTSTELVVVRPAGIGGRDSPGAWGTIRRLVEGGRLVPVPDNDVRHDVVEIETVVAFHLAAATTDVGAGVYTLTGRYPTTLAEYAKCVADQTGSPLRIVKVPQAMLRFSGTVLTGMLRAGGSVRRLGQVVETLGTQRPLVIEPTSKRQD